MSKKDGGPAFPLQATFAGGEYFSGTDGMSLRDYFASKAMQGLVSDDNFRPSDYINALVKLSYEIADAMIAAREQGE
jgi:hypothetical protein